MKIVTARTAGFCMGVRRAVEQALDSANRRKGPIYTYGPLIHNPQVLSILEQKNISVLERIPEAGTGTVIIRAHGVPPRDQEALKQAGFHVINATCPRVIKVQSIIARHARRGYAVIIVGDREHPEVRGLLGYAEDKGHVVDSFEEIEALPALENAIIVAQTTQNTAFFDRVRMWAQEKHPQYMVFNTICDSTEKRQAEVQALAAEVEAVVVVGGYNSGNTRRLVEIAGQSGKKTVQVEKAEELPVEELSQCRNIGITAGASTPNWIIRQVMQHLENRTRGKDGKAGRWACMLVRGLMLSNLYLALGAACLAGAGTWLQSAPVRIHYLVLAGLYTLCMHTLHHMFDRTADRYNDPERAEFYHNYRFALTALAAASGIGGLAVAWILGPLVFAILLFMSFLGVVYNFELEGPWAGIGKISLLKRIPGSKTFLVTVAWGVPAALFPALDAYGGIGVPGAIVFAWICALVFVRTSFFDIIDMQGSRIVGRETIPILLGEKRTMNLLKAVLAAAVLFLPVSAALGVLFPAASVLSLSPAAMLLFLYIHERTSRFWGIWRGVIMESHFILAGILVLLCAYGGS
ncbi:MAG: 4-hydroxy-3-methylbut-2-enyl diphosphate reductase [Desulfobacteraceae bacterium]|nr:4-hydroxy-3-methylbut-2-enyl diphosphate reductase [Desulfobacteraceae bacterium]